MVWVALADVVDGAGELALDAEHGHGLSLGEEALRHEPADALDHALFLVEVRDDDVEAVGVGHGQGRAQGRQGLAVPVDGGDGADLVGHILQNVARARAVVRKVGGLAVKIHLLIGADRVPGGDGRKA